MDSVIKLERKEVYGNTTYYPVSENGKVLAQMLGQKTLTPRDLTLLAQIGYSLQLVEKGLHITGLVTHQQVRNNLLG